MTLDEYHAAWSEDCQLHPDSLDTAALTLPVLHAKWYRYYATERRNWKDADAAFKRLYKLKFEWYTGKMTDDVRVSLGWAPQPLRILDSKLSIYTDADSELQRGLAVRDNAEEKVKFLEEVIKQINNRGYTIKNAIDFLKFKMGV